MYTFALVLVVLTGPNQGNQFILDEDLSYEGCSLARTSLIKEIKGKDKVEIICQPWSFDSQPSHA
ncbi:hypothetical protein, partial [Enterobacter sp. HN503E2II]|uniref:hypothetical protein n=1 Tax=Enterobacter sp. HN503E2II TaxID=2041079 RepID=UPI000E30B016